MSVGATMLARLVSVMSSWSELSCIRARPCWQEKKILFGSGDAWKDVEADEAHLRDLVSALVSALSCLFRVSEAAGKFPQR